MRGKRGEEPGEGKMIPHQQFVEIAVMATQTGNSVLIDLQKLQIS